MKNENLVKILDEGFEYLRDDAFFQVYAKGDERILYAPDRDKIVWRYKEKDG